MTVENGEWIMMGVDADDPSCVHSVEELIDLIDEVGFIPLFRGSIPGFSVEEHTVPDYWFTGDTENDPWEWRMVVTHSRRAAYGKFFGSKAGFVSLACLPDFVNARREGYDFDARWDDEKASMREKKIMDLFAEGHEDAELYSPEIKKRAGFGKGGEKGFEGTLAKLQMQFYLCPIDFKQRINKSGDAFGWSIAVFSTPEHIWGRELVTSAYNKDPRESARIIAKKLLDNYPDISERDIRRIIGTGEHVERKREARRVYKDTYPINLFKELDINQTDFSKVSWVTGTVPEMDYDAPTGDQIMGLEYAIGLMKDKDQDMLRLRFEEGLTFREIGERRNCSAVKAGQDCKRVLNDLRDPSKSLWYAKGLQACRDQKKAEISELRKKLEAKTGKSMRGILASSPLIYDIGYGVCWSLEKAGITTVGELLLTMQDPNWYRGIPGIGKATGRKLELLLRKKGLR